MSRRAAYRAASRPRSAHGTPPAEARPSPGWCAWPVGALVLLQAAACGPPPEPHVHFPPTALETVATAPPTEPARAVGGKQQHTLVGMLVKSPVLVNGQLALDRDSRPVWALASAAPPEISVTPGSRSELALAVGRHRFSLPDRPTRAFVDVVAAGQATRVATVAVREPDVWYEVRVDLAPWAGRSITVRLSQEPPASLTWSSPRMCPRDAADAPPSVAIVLLDTLRRDALGCYAGAGRETPNIDRLAAASTLFEDARAPAPWTLPSVMSLMTGLPPHRVGGLNNPPMLDADHDVLAGRLEGSGYLSMGVSANPTVGPQTRLHVGFSRFLTFPALDPPAKEVTERTLALLRETKGHPRFLYVHYMDPHDPYAGDAGDRITVGDLRDAADRGVPCAAEAPDVDLMRRRYQDDVRALDADLGLLLDFLVAERFVVVLLSDHGEEFFEHGGFGHGQSLHDELLRVPLLLHLPGRPAGRIAASVATSNVAATLARLAGATFGGEDLLSGSSFRPGVAETLSSLPGRRRDFLRLSAAWNGRYKLVYDVANASFVTYDLERDPGERQHDDIPLEDVRSLLGNIHAWQPRDERADAQDHELEETMKALGYVR